MKSLKCNKAPGEDNITGGIHQDGGGAMIHVLTDLFNMCLHHQQVPKAWKNALIVLIHKKGNTPDTKNQSACFPLCTMCFQTFFYKGGFIRQTSTTHVSKPDFGQAIPP